MRKGFVGNEDWIARDQGRIPTKGAMAAERASAGLGTSDDDDAAHLVYVGVVTALTKLVPSGSEAGTP
jgi:hypothetical protein